MDHNKVYQITEDVKFCFWDKHEFTGCGVMCPIFYKPKQVVRRKKEYYINQNISRTSPIVDTSSAFVTNKVIDCEIYYDDMFCSHECCLAWINSNSHDPKYKNSKQILFNETLFNDTIPKAASHWKTLKKFGGFLDIDEFRSMKSRYEMKDYFFENGKTKEIFNEVFQCE